MPRPLVTFLCSNVCVWGGSEELWHAAALELRSRGMSVRVIRSNILADHPRMQAVRAADIPVLDSRVGPSIPARLALRLIARGGRLAAVGHLIRRGDLKLRRLNPLLSSGIRSSGVWPLNPIVRDLMENPPALAVISQGDNYDGAQFSEYCTALGVPFVVISHKAREDRWPHDGERQRFRAMFQRAERAYFVSEHNRALTQKQLGWRIDHADVVRNPHLTRVPEPLPWPAPADGGLRLACVGRLLAFDKGQDLLLEVLALPKWRARDLHVAFFGEGVNKQGLQDMASGLGLQRVSFPGFVDDIVAIWRDHHALVLPSRGEGLPISLVEAMMCGRIGIVTRVGGSAEPIADNHTGFIADSPSVAAIDEALERAWACRQDWGRMGEAAARSIRQIVPDEPAAVFADLLQGVLHRSGRRA